MGSNWDTETADNCRLPELLPAICQDCRDYAYCYRQMSIEDLKCSPNRHLTINHDLPKQERR